MGVIQAAFFGKDWITIQMKEGLSARSVSSLPDGLRNGIESLAGLSMDHVRVHYNSSQPGQLNAVAYAQGTNIHISPGQENHLPHEAWHVVQQAQGRVRPTIQMKAEANPLPVTLRNGVESLSGLSMDHVRVHYNSAQPAQLNALAYAQGTDIHVSPGQERHLPHEAWHVVQHAQGRVRPTIQMKPGPHARPVSSPLTTIGLPLPPEVRKKMESALGANFSNVRVHVGLGAEQIGAVAFTCGDRIHFAPGQYNPHTLKGQILLGHELTHVVQQREGRVKSPFGGGGVAIVQDQALEDEADRVGLRAATSAMS